MSATLASIETNECEGTWIRQELLGCTFNDKRLAKRFGMVLQQLSEGMSESIPPYAKTGRTRRRHIASSRTSASAKHIRSAGYRCTRAYP
jgi:hypothetical protein